MVDIIVILETASASHHYARRFFSNQTRQSYQSTTLNSCSRGFMMVILKPFILLFSNRYLMTRMEF